MIYDEEVTLKECEESRITRMPRSSPSPATDAGLPLDIGSAPRYRSPT